jgi:hypothetical protein
MQMINSYSLEQLAKAKVDQLLRDARAHDTTRRARQVPSSRALAAAAKEGTRAPSPGISAAIR